MHKYMALLLLGTIGCAVGTRAGNDLRPASGAPKGTLFIVGGGSQSNDLVRQFIALAGGPGKARIAILPMASASAQETGDDKKAQLDTMGAMSFVINVNRSQANSDSVVRLISSATGIWFPGGDQSRLTAAIEGTPVHRAIMERFQAGAVVGGTSAGAAVMSDSMITGNQYFPGLAAAADSPSFQRIGRHTIEMVKGLGFVHNAIMDQHFIRRQRQNRLFSVVLERPTLIGAGIDEGTALKITPDGMWTVLGRSSVMIIDARNSASTRSNAPVLGATGMQVSILPAGSTYDPRTGRAILPVH